MKKGYSQKRNRLADQIDFNDAIYMAQRAHSPIVYCEPVPITTYKEGAYKGHDRIHPHVSRFYHADGLATDVIHQKPVYYLHQNGGWRPLSEVAYSYGRSYIVLKEDWDKVMDLRYLAWLLKIVPRIEIPSPFGSTLRLSEKYEIGTAKIAFSVSTFYPAAGNNSPCDGYTQKSTAVGATWDSLRDGTANGADATNADTTLCQITRQATNEKSINRAIVNFNTASIADSDVITAALISFYDNGGSTSQPLNGGAHSIGVHQASPASTSTIATTDHPLVSNSKNSPTEGATRLNFTSLIGTGTYQDFTLNSTGRGWISKTGVTSFGFRHNNDIDNVEPTVQGGAYSGWRVYMADRTGTSQDPKHTVTHAPPFTPRFAIVI